MYFPVSWVDEKTNTHYRKGYYDEMGNHYDDIAFKKNGEYTASFHCDYCDSDLKYAWKEGAAPKCPNCGAELNEMGIVTDEIVEEPVGAGNSASIAKKIVIGYFSIIFGFMFLGCIGSIASNAFGSHEYNDYEYSEDYDDYEETYGAYNPDLFGDTYYVEEIGRDCEWLDEYESYYDEDTDCYFYYNVDLEPAIWQYWYEDISSDYGDYGWMEYAEDEDSWYIEDRGGHWIELPDEYDTSYLWHIDD